LRPYYIVLSYQAFKKYFQELKEGDLIGIRLPLKKEEIGLIIDLLNRKVEAFPSFLSQVLSTSKTLQAEILKDFILPYTFAIRDKTTLLSAISELSKLESTFKKFVTKDDRANCGLGVRLWNSLEEIFNIAGTPVLPYPFVLQPFFENVRDIRVVILGEYYIEAYELNKKEIEFCKKVMERGKFPYAHLDLIYIGDKGPYISEISLKGGIKGAKINHKEYEEIIKKIHQEFYKKWEEKYSPVEYLTP
jgi:ribosomal protein S6--L-glutamate ligase